MNNLLRLLQLSDPALPIGGFSHSYGLETYVQIGRIHDKSAAEQFIIQMLSQNIRYTDAAFVSLAYDAAATGDIGKIIELDNQCSALKLAKEPRQASWKLGLRLLKMFTAIEGHDLLIGLQQAAERKSIDANYSVVFGVLASVFQIAKRDALSGFYYNAAAGMVTNSVKLVPLGQQDGQSILFSLQPLIQSMVEESLTPDVDKLGLCCPGFDIVIKAR